MSKKHGTPPDPEKEPLLFPEIGGIEKRGLAALVEAQTRLGKNLSDFLPWYFEHNPAWMQNALWEIVGAAAESLRDFIGRQAADPIQEPFSVEFRFPVSVSPHSLYIEPPPELDLLEIPPGELAAFRERGHEISAAAVDRILTEKAEEAAREGQTAPEITPEKRAELIRVAEASGEGLIAENAERNLQSDLGEWFTAWRWAFTINAGWSNYREAGAASEPEAETLCLFHFPDPARAEPDPLWKNSQTFAFRLQTLQALPETGDNWQLPECTSPEAMEGKRLFESLCPDGMISRMAIPITALNGETDPDKDTGERRKISFTITLEIHPLTFDFRGEGGAELTEPETYFPLVVRCDRGPGAAGWHELTPEERGDLFRQIIELIEGKATPETWDFPGWQPLVADTDQGEEKQSRKPKKKRGAAPAEILPLHRAEVRERLRPKQPKLEGPNPFETRSHKIGRILTLPGKIDNPAQTLLPFDLKPGVPLGNWKNAEIVTVGFDFNVHERRVIDAMERLYEQYGFPDSLVVMTDIDTFAKACDAEKRATGKDLVARFSGRELCDLLAAVQSVASKKGMFIYDDPDYPRLTLTTTGYLWQPITGFSDLTPEEKENLRNLKFTEGMRAKLRTIGIRFDPLWKRAERGTTGKPLYYHRPANLREQLFIAGYLRRSTQTEAFLTWLFTEGEPIMHGHREWSNEPAIEIPIARLAAICRLERHVQRGDRKRAAREIVKAAGYAKAVGLITNDPATAYDPERGVFRFELKDGKHWNDLHAWQAEKKAEEAARAAEKSARDAEKAEKEKARAQRKIKKAADIPAPATWEADIAAAEKQRLEHLAMMVKEWRETGWDSKRKPIAAFQDSIWSEKRKEGNRTDIGPEERTARCAMLKRIDEAISAELRGGAMPQPRTKARPDPARPAAPVANEQPPAPDPAAAEIWKPFFDSLSKSMKEKAAAAVPARIEETAEGRRLVLWLPFPSLGFKTSGDDFKGQARAAGFALDWLESGER